MQMNLQLHQQQLQLELLQRQMQQQQIMARAVVSEPDNDLATKSFPFSLPRFGNRPGHREVEISVCSMGIRIGARFRNGEVPGSRASSFFETAPRIPR